MGFKKRWKVFKFKTKTCISACFSISACILEEDGVAAEDSIAEAPRCKEALIFWGSQKPEPIQACRTVEEISAVMYQHIQENVSLETQGRHVDADRRESKDAIDPILENDPREVKIETPFNWCGSAKPDFVEETAPHNPDLDQTLPKVAAVKGLITHAANFAPEEGFPGSIPEKTALEKEATTFAEVLEALNLFQMKIAYAETAVVGDDAKNRATGGIAAEEIEDDYPDKIDQTKKRDAPILDNYAQPNVDIISWLNLSCGSNSIMASKQKNQFEGGVVMTDIFIFPHLETRHSPFQLGFPTRKGSIQNSMQQ